MAQEETAKAIEYAEKWDIQSTFEDAVTNLLVSHPDDPMGFLYDQIVSKAAPPTIDKVLGREILDGQGQPTLEVEVWGFVYGKSEFLGVASAPSCDFCSPDDAFVCVDNNASRFHGKGARQAVSLVTSVLQPVLEHRQFYDQRDLDGSIAGADGTTNHRKIGCNTVIATSAAVAIAAAKVLRLPLYVHLSRTISSHEVLTIPRPIFPIFNIMFAPNSSSPKFVSKVYLLPSSGVPFEDQVRIVGEIYAHYESTMHCSICNDGCFPLEASALDEILAAIEIAVSGGGHTLGDDVFLGFKGGPDATEQFWLESFEQSQVIVYVEDPLPFEATNGWHSLVKATGEKAVVAMGEGLSSKSERISPELECSAVVIRPPQAGTFTKCADAAAQVERCSRRTVIATSERETQDTWICDLAVACGASYIQLGSLSKAENIAKINRLFEIAHEMEKEYDQ